MNTNPVFCFLALVLLSGCAIQDKLTSRQRAYERLLGYMEPGMTRRQLYALLPPARTPLAFPPRLFGTAGLAIFFPQFEEYPLDQDFWLNVQYEVADPSAARVTLPVKIPNRRASASNTVDPSVIDALVRARSHPSKQNPDDKLVARPFLTRRVQGKANYPFVAD